MSRARKWGLIVTLVLVLATPALAHAFMFWSYAGAYAGVCGPHAPDIAQHPCSYEQYRAEFGQGFEGVGLFIFDGIAGAIAATVAAVGWLVVLVFFSRRPAT